MALLTWNDRYSVGDPAVDHEHRELIDLINQVHAELQAAGPGAAEARFGDLYRGISAHFALEEKQMRAARYPEYAAHKADHESLLDEIRDMMEEGAASDEELSRRLDAWFSRHFATFDARLHKKIGHGHG